MLSFFIVVLLCGAPFLNTYYFLYVQTDEGLPEAVAERRHKARMQCWQMLNVMAGRRDWPLPKQERLDAERLERIQFNKEQIQEWPLATDEELAAYDAPNLQARLDSRNAHCDQIIALLCELEDFVNRSPERQKQIGKRIRKLRMAPLKELVQQSDSRVHEILARHD